MATQVTATAIAAHRETPSFFRRVARSSLPERLVGKGYAESFEPEIAKTPLRRIGDAEEVADFLAGSGLADAPILPVSALSGEGVDALREALVDLHPYDVPEVVGLPIERGHAPYLNWIDESVRPS